MVLVFLQSWVTHFDLNGKRELTEKELFREMDRAIMNVAQHADVATFEKIGQKYETVVADVALLTAIYMAAFRDEPKAFTAILGKVEVNSDDERKKLGAFFTPRYIAAYIVKQTIGPMIRDKKIGEIAEMKICDPAMGGGIFLLEAHNFLFWTMFLKNRREHTYDNEQLSRMALGCLYGVDIQPNMVEITKILLNLNHWKFAEWKRSLTEFARFAKNPSP